MSDTVIIAAIREIASIVVAVVSMIFAVMAKRSADTAATTARANGEKADKAVVRANESMSKIDKIHADTNGKLSGLEQKVALYEQEIANLKAARGLAAETSAAAVEAALATTPPEQKA